MDERRSRFTWRELSLVLGIVGLMIAVLIPAVSNAIEAARRTSCNGYLKQVGLGIQNYHDIRQEICPSYLTDNHSPAAVPSGFPTWPVLLLPYVEQQNVYALLDLSQPLDENAGPPANHELLRTTPLQSYSCYSRRGMWSSAYLFGNGPEGPFVVGDFACVSRANAHRDNAEPRTWDAAMLASRVFNASKDKNQQRLGDFEPGTLNPREFRSMTTFDSILDGLSNTVFIGEKAIQTGQLGGAQDGPYYYGRGGNPADLNSPGAMANWSRRLTPLHAGERLLPLRPRKEPPQNRFGGWHPGITLFLLGDGSVRQVNNATATKVLQRLGCRNDGQTFDLP